MKGVKLLDGVDADKFNLVYTGGTWTTFKYKQVTCETYHANFPQISH